MVSELKCLVHTIHVRDFCLTVVIVIKGREGRTGQMLQPTVPLSRSVLQASRGLAASSTCAGFLGMHN